MTDLLYRRIPVSPRAARFGAAAPAGEALPPRRSPAEYRELPAVLGYGALFVAIETALWVRSSYALMVAVAVLFGTPIGAMVAWLVKPLFRDDGGGR